MDADQTSPWRLADPVPCDLPYDITWDDLTRSSLDLAEPGRSWITHVKQGKHQGGRPSVIMTLNGPRPDGTQHETTVFFKYNTGKTREADAYRFLGERSVPVPNLLLSLEREADEVLGLEFLPSIGIEPDHVDDLIELVAQLNVQQDIPTSIAETPPGMPQAEFERVLTRSTVQVGTALPSLDTSRWLQTYRTVLPRYAALPTALTHGELALQQVGCRTNGQLVLVDLATLGLRPRFFDIANLLAPLVGLSGQSERTLFARYLDHLPASTTPTSAAAWAELRLTRFVQHLEALPWQPSIDDNDHLRDYAMIIAAEVGRLHAL